MKLKFLILILALQTAWLLGTVITNENALVRGSVILLETRPVDPRDLLRGDYLILNYKISDVPKTSFIPPLKNELPAGETIWIALARRGDFHEIIRASRERFEPAEDEVLLRAEKIWSGRGPDTESVQLGLERFYVREGTGNPQGKITVQAVVPASGRARIKRVFLDGKPYGEAMKESAR